MCRMHSSVPTNSTYTTVAAKQRYQQSNGHQAVWNTSRQSKEQELSNREKQAQTDSIVNQPKLQADSINQKYKQSNEQWKCEGTSNAE
jgi:hypothetical protein